MAKDNRVVNHKHTEDSPEVEYYGDKPRNASEITIGVSLDADDAIKSLKAIQREAREATKALRELEAENKHRFNNGIIALLCSKIEGENFSNMTIVTTDKERLDSEITRLRGEGYRIFYVMGCDYIIDDYLK